MKAERLLQHFDRISEAPGAIPRLWRIILDLAVRGKLVEQDPNDEPTEELLKRIETEKKRLMKEGEIKKLEKFTPVESREIPFAIPSGWQSIRMGWLARKLGAGSTPLGGKTVYQSEGVPFLRSQNVHNNGLRLNDVALIPRAVHERMSGTHVQQHDILLNITGASIGRCTLVPSSFVEGNVSQHVAIIRLFAPEIGSFIHLSLISPFFQELIDEMQVGVSRAGLSMQRFKSFPMLLPPLAEQHRIVSKVNELMALCAQLEAAKNQREQSRDRLVAASLHRLNQPTDDTEDNRPEAFRDHASFTLSHLPCLTTRVEHIKQLRQTILNLAVRGKLVPQSPNEEPGHLLLQRVLSDLSVKKSAKTFDDGSNSAELSFELPKGWSVARLGSILQPTRGISYGIIKLGPEPHQGGVSVLRCSNVRFRRLDLDGVRKVTEELSKQYGRTILDGGEVLINVRGTLGGCAVVPRSLQGFNIAREVAVIPVHPEIDAMFLLNVIAAPYFQDRVYENLRGIAYEGLNLGLLRSFPIPIPPLGEQRRIVAKVDELMALCDQLEAQLTTSEADSRRLLEAVLHEAWAPAL